MDSEDIYLENGGHLKSFLFSPHVYALELLGKVYSLLSRVHLRGNFLLKPSFSNLDSNLSFGASAIFAHGHLDHHGKRYSALRLVFRRKKEPILGPGILLETFQTGERPAHEFIDHAEDPRLFEYRGHAFAYYQIPNLQISDTAIFIRNLSTHETHRILSPFGFSGKNWIPFVYREELYFIYGLSPLIIIKPENLNGKVVESKVFFTDAAPEAKFFWNDDVNRSFSAFRGGSRLIELEDGTFLGFVHITSYGKFKDSHQLGLVQLYPDQWRVKLRELSSIKPRYLIDPYGIEIKNSYAYAICSVTTGNPSRFATITADYKVGWEVSRLLEFLN